MKRLIFVMFLTLICVASWAANTVTPSRMTSLGIGTEAQTDAATQPIDNGDLFVSSCVEVNGSVFIEEDLNLSGGLQGLVIHEEWAAPVAADSDVIKTVEISTGTLVNETSSWAETYMTCFAPPRTIGASIDEANAYPESLLGTTNYMYGTVTLTGYDAKYEAISEVVIATAGIVTYSLNAFSRITSAVWTLTDCNNSKDEELALVKCNLGTGVKLGLCRDVRAVSDVFLIDENGTGIRPTSSHIDVTYDTVDFETDPAATKRGIWYKPQ